MKKRQTKKTTKNINLPYYCKVGYIEYGIYFEEKIKDVENNELKLYGYLDNDTDKIYVEKNKNESHMKVTLLHEITHAIDKYAAIGLTEEQIEALTSILWDTMDKNYKVKSYIFG